MLFSVYISIILKLFLTLMCLCNIGNVYSQDLLSSTTRRPNISDPLNTDDFSEIVNLPVFIDKTMLIKDFIKGPPRIIITAPHEFGKSVNLNMLHRFLSYPNNTNELQDGNVTYDCRIFMNRNLSIYQDKTFFYEHCGQYPVIYADFLKLVVYYKEEVINSFKYAVYSTFRYHDYLVKRIDEETWEWTSKKMLGMNVETFLTYWNLTRFKAIPQVEMELHLIKSFAYLSQVLYTYHEKKVVVLIDQFDAVWLKIISQPDSKSKYVSGLYGRLVRKLLLRNHFIHRVFIMSCMTYAPFLFLNETNNIQIFSMQENHRYAKYFGFTSDEVESLMEKFMIHHDLKTVKTWYNGFTVPEQNLSLYNPWSIVHYVHEGILKTYSNNFGYTHNIRKVALLNKIRMTLMKLAHDAPVTITLFPIPADDDYVHCCKVMFCHPAQIWRVENRDNYFVNYLYECGLVRLAKVLKGKRNMVKVASPNFETVQSLFRYMYSRLYYEKHFKFKTNRMFEVLDMFSMLDKTTYIQRMFTHLTNSIARLFTYTRLPEDKYALGYAFYHMLNLINMHPVVHIEVSPWVERRQRCIFVSLIRNDGTTIIMETRYGSNDTAEMALKCIIEHQYYEVLEDRYDYGIQMTGSRIYMGVLLDEEKYVEICYLVNSTNINEKRCVSNAVNIGVPVYIAAKIRSLLDYYVAMKGNSSILQIPKPLMRLVGTSTRRTTIPPTRRRLRLS